MHITIHTTLFLLALVTLLGLVAADLDYDTDLEHPPLCPGHTEPGCCRLELDQRSMQCGSAENPDTIEELKAYCARSNSTPLCCIDFSAERPVGCVYATRLKGKWNYPYWWEKRSRPPCLP